MSKPAKLILALLGIVLDTVFSIGAATPTYAANVDDCLEAVEVNILSPSGDGYFKASDGSGTSYIADIIADILLYGIGIVATASIVISGIMYATSQGDVTRTTKAKKRIIASAVGLLTYALIWSGLQFLLPGGLFTGDDSDYTYGEGSASTDSLRVNEWKLTDDNRMVYCGANGRQAFGNYTVDGVDLYFNDDGVVDLGGWDFTDWEYVNTMTKKAEAGGNETGWFVTVDTRPPCRMCVFRKVGDRWVPVAGWYTVVGRWTDAGTTTITSGPYKGTYRGASTTINGIHQVKTYLRDIPMYPPGRVIGLLDYWDPETGEYHGQAIHAGNGGVNGVPAGEWGYGNSSCASLTTDHMDWLYENFPRYSNVETINPGRGFDSPDRINSPFGHDYLLDAHPYAYTV